jgi:hypothetical protein
LGIAANFRRSAAPLITTIQKHFREDLAGENDFLRQETKILRSKLGKRVPLTEADHRTLVRYGLSIKERLAEVIIIVPPETLLAWNRRMTADLRPGARSCDAVARPVAEQNRRRPKMGWGTARFLS